MAFGGLEAFLSGLNVFLLGLHTPLLVLVPATLRPVLPSQNHIKIAPAFRTSKNQEKWAQGLQNDLRKWAFFDHFLETWKWWFTQQALYMMDIGPSQVAPENDPEIRTCI